MSETEKLNNVLEYGKSNEVNKDEWIVALLSSIAASLAVIADAKTDMMKHYEHERADDKNQGTTIKRHELKIMPNYFDAVRKGNKNFELRRDDRDYKVGDLIKLREFNGVEYTGRESQWIPIRYILRKCEYYGLKNGYCILGF